MKKLKVITVLGTRPEIIRLSECIKLCDEYFDHKLVHTGQNWDYTLNEVFFKELGLREPDYYLDCAGKDLGETMGNIIARSYKIIREIMPDALLILGDTNSSLATLSAKRLKVPIFHMEAGNRCWDWNVPEMINRTIVDHIADINLPYTEISRKYLLSEGMDGKTIFVTGSPMREVLHKNKEKIDRSTILSDLNLGKNKYILVSAHREENIDDLNNFTSLMESLNTIAGFFDMPIIYSTHPRSKKKLEERNFKFDSRIKSTKPFGFIDYVNLQKNAFCVLSDSGTLSEESAILNFPAVLIRTSTERPEVLDSGNIVIGGINSHEILQAVKVAVNLNSSSRGNIPDDYMDENVSQKVVRIIQSYAKIVDIKTWKK